MISEFYQRPAPEVFKRPKVMFMVYDPGLGLNTYEVQLKSIMVTKITEHGFIKVAAASQRGTTAVRWQDEDRLTREGTWIFTDEHKAVAFYRERLQHRVSYARSLLNGYQKTLIGYDTLLLDKPVFELNVLERARWDHVNDLNSEKTY